MSKYLIFIVIFFYGCTNVPIITEEDKLIDMECALKNSVPSIHDEVL